MIRECSLSLTFFAGALELLLLHLSEFGLALCVDVSFSAASPVPDWMLSVLLSNLLQ